MRRASSTTVLLLVALAATAATPIDDTTLVNGTVLQIVNNLTLIDHELHLLNGTADAEDDQGTVRKKRTFGDLVFRGLADVFGYNVQRKPPQTVFPPPVAPLPQFNVQVQAQAAQPAQTPCAAAAVRVAPVNPCARALQQAAQPCGRQRLADNPCNLVQDPPPCDALVQTTPKPPDTVSSTLQLNFAFNRNNKAAQQSQADAKPPNLSDDAIERAPKAPFNPQPARLPPPPPPPPRTRKPKVFIDAFVVRRNGETEKLHTADSSQFNPDNYDDAPSDYDDAPPPSYDYYEDAQESQAQNRRAPNNNNYSPQRQVKYASRGRPWSQSLKVAPNNPNKIPIEEKRKYNPAERVHNNGNDYLYNDEPEGTTSTEDPQKALVPRVLPPTENHPNQIDTVTVRVPPIYRAKNPRKLHQADDVTTTTPASSAEEYKAPPRRRKKKKIIKVRNIRNIRRPPPKPAPLKSYEEKRYGTSLEDSDGASDYSSPETMAYSAPSGSRDADVERAEAAPHPWNSSENDRFIADESERDTDERERDVSNERRYLADESERGHPDSPDPHRADEAEKTSRLSPNAVVYEQGYSTSYAKVTASRVDDDKPKVIKITRKKVDDDDDDLLL